MSLTASVDSNYSLVIESPEDSKRYLVWADSEFECV